MDAPTRGATRLARAAAFGVATLALAAGAHIAAGGALPSMMVLAILSVPVAVASLALTSRRCGPVLLVASLTATQVMLHETLMAMVTQIPRDMAGQMSAASSFSVAGTTTAHTMSHPMAQTMATTGAHVGDWSATMTAAHVLAIVVTALLLARGEQAVWQLVARLLPTLPCLMRVLACGPRQAPVLLSVPVLRPSLVSGGSGLRGPPVRFLATA